MQSTLFIDRHSGPGGWGDKKTEGAENIVNFLRAKLTPQQGRDWRFILLTPYVHVGLCGQVLFGCAGWSFSYQIQHLAFSCKRRVISFGWPSLCANS